MQITHIHDSLRFAKKLHWKVQEYNIYSFRLSRNLYFCPFSVFFLYIHSTGSNSSLLVCSAEWSHVGVQVSATDCKVIRDALLYKCYV